MERAGDLLGFISNNSGVFLASLAILFAAGLGVAFYNAHATRVAEEADTALFTAQKSFTDAVKKVEKPKPAPGADAATKDSAKDAAAAAVSPEVLKEAVKPSLEALMKVAADFSGSRAAFEAELFVGDFYLKHGDGAKAVEIFKSAADHARPRAAKPAALYALAYAYENAANYEGAVDALRQVVAADNPVYKMDATLALARNYALKGDKPKAIEAYGQVVKDYPNSPASKQAEIASARIH